MALSSAERLAIARELHDGIAQDLVGIGYSLDLLLADPESSQESRSQLRRARLEVDELLAKVRHEIFNLRADEDIQLPEALETLAQTSLTTATYLFIKEEVAPTQETAKQFLAIAAEILRNIQNHSRATHVAIHLYPVNNRTCLEISDNGIGGIQMKDGHFGLQGIFERVESLGGSITIDIVQGTQFVILL